MHILPLRNSSNYSLKKNVRTELIWLSIMKNGVDLEALEGKWIDLLGDQRNA